MPSEQTYIQDLVASATHLMICIDETGGILFANPAWCQTLGVSESEILGMPLRDLVHPDYHMEYEKLLRQAENDESVGRFEICFQTPDGRIVDVEGSFVCSNRAQQPRIIQGIFLDVTERKRAEDVLTRQATALLRVHSSLEARDRELADTLEQARKLKEAQERAEELAEINYELTQEVARRKEAEAQIRASLQEKEVLLKEIHHRVKNNLQIITSLLNLQSGYTQDSETLSMFRESQSRIHSMALVHEKLYQSEDLARVDFADYIQSLVDFLMRSYGRVGISTTLDVAPVFFSLDTSIPCGLIVSELVTNALKHAFPENRVGEIYVNLKPTKDEHYLLTVGDTGIGFPDGLDFEKTESLGLQLVNSLSEQLDGEIELDGSRGTEFQIGFKVHKSDRT